MKKGIFTVMAERSFRRRARKYLIKTYGDIFSWQAVLEMGGQPTAHRFSAAANDMSVVCQAHDVKMKKGTCPEETLNELKEAVFCLAFMPAHYRKLLLIPKISEKERQALCKAAAIPASVEVVCV